MRSSNIWKVLSLSCLMTVALNSDAFSDYVVQIGGTVEAGELNTMDLSGQQFVMEANFGSPFGPDDFNNSGTFISDTASVEFSGGDKFEFDSGDLKLNVFLGDFNGNPAFSVGFILDDLPAQNGYFEYIVFSDLDISDTGDLFNGYDPEVLTSLSYTEFTEPFALDFQTTNSNGDSLVISSVGLPAFYNAVPVPTASPLLTLVLLGIGFRRKREAISGKTDLESE